jgi:hypothetical protein
MEEYSEDQVISLIFKVEYTNTIRSFSKRLKVTNNPKFKNELLSNIESYVTLNAEHYEDLIVDSIFIDYSLSEYPLSHSK